MTEKFKSVWEKVEKGIGVCCLHKKAAFNEAYGKELQQLSLVTSALPSVIEEFAKNGFQKINDGRYRFEFDGIVVEIQSISNAKDISELQQRSFKQTLTVDSVGFSRDGKINDGFGGMQDIKDKVIRLTDENTSFTEGALSRVMYLATEEGFTVHPSVMDRIVKGNILGKFGHRKRLFELLTAKVNKPSVEWKKISALLQIAPNYLKDSYIVDYTAKLPSDVDADFKRNYLFLIFALLNATSSEIGGFFKGDNHIDYFDSMCSKLNTTISGYMEFMEIKNNYGQEFLDVLFDVQEILMASKGIPFKRLCERDFDLMAALVGDENYWSTPKEELPIEEDEEPITEQQDSMEIEGTLNVSKAISTEFDEGLYDDPTEGPANDDYVLDNEENQAIPSVQKKEVCIDDEEYSVPAGYEGFNVVGMEHYENEHPSAQSNSSRTENKVSTSASNSDSSGVMNHTRGHSSKILRNGGE